MAFWGVEVKPEKPYIHRYNIDEGRLHLSQATLGAGTSNKKCTLQCSVGSKRPIYLCSLSPDKLENCALNVEFEEDEEVTLSVIGSHSVHLSGFFIGEYGDEDEGDSDQFDGHCVDSECESDESMDYDIEDEDDDLSDDDDLDIYPAAHVRPSGVKIEEILDDEKLAKEKGASKQTKKKKHQTSESNDGKNSEKQIVVKSSSQLHVLESEDEDGFPISSPGQRNTGNSNKEAVNDNKVEDAPGKKDTVGLDQANSETSTKIGKRKKKKSVKDAEENIPEENGKISSLQEANLDNANQTNEKEKLKEKKNKNKKKKRKTENEAVLNAQETTTDKNVSTVESELENEAEPFQVRSFPNGLVIEEVSMGKPDGKKADQGKKVSVRYIGKLKKNGKIFDSNIGKAPFKFRLGIGQVIKGWDVGVKGMRVGDKRRLTIPPSMGYGSTGAGSAIPPNAWLVFDVELIDVM